MIEVKRKTKIILTAFAVCACASIGYVIEKFEGEKFSTVIYSAEGFSYAGLSYDGGSYGSEIIGGMVNINAADSQTLQSLDGIGESTAEKIIEYRTQNGGFKSVEDLTAVSGIGANLLDNLRAYICIE